jgi:hypothetical protein
MNDPDNFLSRWSRRKREAAAETEQPAKMDAGRVGKSAESEQPDQGMPGSEEVATSAPAFDVRSLPPIETIGPGTDITPFMQPGVPSALRHAALRRAWSADPAIRNFMGPTENYWDAAAPDGVPGFGDLDLGFNAKQMVSELFGERAPERAHSDPDLAEPSNISASPSAGIAEGHGEANTAGRSEQKSAANDVATQKQSSQSQPPQKIARRHGGAIPE